MKSSALIPHFASSPVGRLASIIILVTAVGCGGGGGGGGGTPTGPTPAIALALSAPNASVQQGGSSTVTATITRTGGYTGTVNLAVTGMPTGITSSVSALTTSGTTTTATITLAASASVTPQAYGLTVGASGSGVESVTMPLSLAVTAAASGGGFTLAVSGSPVAVPQGGTGRATVTITRTGGFTGPVALAVQGAPAGLSATVDPPSTTGTTATLTFTASPSLAVSTYTLTVRGTATGLADVTTPAQATVTAAVAGGDVTIDFSRCSNDPRIIWVAHQDGNGPWIQIPGATDGIYHFAIDAAKGAFAYVSQSPSGGATTVNVESMTAAEMTAAPIIICGSDIGSKSVTGSVTGLTNQTVDVSLGGAFSAVPPTPGTFGLPGVRDGNHDLVAYRNGGQPSTADRIIIRRDQDIPNLGTIDPLDFGAAEAFAPTPATIVVNDPAASPGFAEAMSYLTGASCDVAPFYANIFVTTTGAPNTFGVPAAQQRATDFHLLSVAVATSTTSRTLETTFHTMASRTVTLGHDLGGPTVTDVGTSYKRLQATFTLPAEYDLNTTLTYTGSSPIDGSPRQVILTATPGWFGSTAATFALPDFHGVSGWTDGWAPPTGVADRWTLAGNGGAWVMQAIGGTPRTAICAEGAHAVRATATGRN